MGLDCSHDAFHGAYSAFDRLRWFVLKSIGGSYPPHEDKSLNGEMWYFGDGYDTETHKGLTEFLSHSDCDGEISAETCKVVADELEAILPNIEQLAITEPVHGHLLNCGGYVEVIKKFINGCRLAHNQNEPLIFM